MRSSDRDHHRETIEFDVLHNAGEVVGSPIDRAAAWLPVDLIGDDEVILLLLRPSLLFVILGALPSIVTILFFTLILAYLARTVSWVPWTDAQAFGLGALLLLVRIIWQALEWWSRIYVLTDRRLIRKMGVFQVSIFETPLKHVQHTSVFVLLRERFFGLGSIGFATSGSDTYEAFWVMISQPFAVHRSVVEAIERYGR